MTQDQEAAIRVLWEETPLSASKIGARFGIVKSTVINIVRRHGWKSYNRRPGILGAGMLGDREAEVRLLWEKTPQSAKTIAAQYGVTRCALIGIAQRRGWVSFNKGKGGHYPNEPRTTFDRCDAWEAYMDRVLAETEPAIRDRLVEAEREAW